jgi:two-component system response regulator AtoC
LRKRPEDVIPLLNYFLEKYSKELKSEDIPDLNDKLLKRINHHKWPGNVRELQNFVRRYILLGEKEIDLPYLQTENLINSIDSNQYCYHAKPLDLENIDLKNMALKAKNREEKRIISYVLSKTGWNKSSAAKILKISYKTLLYKIDDFKIHPKKINDIKVIGFPKSNYLEHPNSELVREIHI